MDTGSIYDIAEIRRRLDPVFRANGVKSAVLFGSYATGEAAANSDIDIMVDSGLRGLDFVGLIEHVREALQKDVDIMDIHYIDRESPIERAVNNTGISIYG